MTPLKCYRIKESSVISPSLESDLSIEFIRECRKREFIYGNKLNWSHYVGILRDKDVAVIIDPKYRNTNFDMLFRYAIVPKQYRTEKYKKALSELFIYMPSRRGRPRMIDYEEGELDTITHIIKSFRRAISRTKIQRESGAIRKVVTKLNKCFNGGRIERFPQFVFDMAKLWELYIYGIIVRCVPKDTVLYQKKHNHLIPDYIVSGDELHSGFIADAKYLSVATKVRENDLHRMEKYARDSYFRKLTSFIGEKPTCYFFCSSKNGISADAIENAATWEEIARKMAGCGDNPFYRISVAIPRT